MSASKKPTFTPKMASKISVPILSNVVPVLSSLSAAVSEAPKAFQAPVVDASGSASAIAISSMPAKKRPLHGNASSVSQTADASNNGVSPRDSAARSTSSDSSYEDDVDLVIFETKGGNKQSAAVAASSNGRNKKRGAPVIIVPNSSSSSSSAVALGKYDLLSRPDHRPLSNSSSSSSSAHRTKAPAAHSSSPSSSPQPKEKRSRVRKPKPTSEVLPTSMPTPKSIIKMTKYFRKTPEGIVGITFTNMDNRPVVDTIDRSLYPETHNNNGSLPHHIMSGDVVISVNSLDSRFTAYERLMSELVLKGSNNGGAAGGGAVGGSGDDRASIKNSVTDSMAVVVLARPVYA